MTRTIMRSAVLFGLGLTLTACAQHDPARANCFTFHDTPPSASARSTSTTTTISTMGAEVARRDSPCEFVMLGAGG